MPGDGKYTVYAAPKTDKNTLLNKLFSVNAGQAITLQMANYDAGEVAVRTAVVDLGKQYLQPVGGIAQPGDPGLFPNGVILDYTQAPDVPAEVKWNVAGDPANPYVPDITSPGPGKTSGLEKDADPQIKIDDIKPGYVQSADTLSPKTTSDKLSNYIRLGGGPGKLGNSGANS